MSTELLYLCVGLSVGFALGYAFETLRDFFMERR